MTIEIEEPELEQRIQQLMDSGGYSSVEDLVRQALDGVALRRDPSDPPMKKQNFGDFLRNSPLWGADLKIERSKDGPRDPNL